LKVALLSGFVSFLSSLLIIKHSGRSKPLPYEMQIFKKYYKNNLTATNSSVLENFEDKAHRKKAR
jgi:hypothetical protein